MDKFRAKILLEQTRDQFHVQKVVASDIQKSIDTNPFEQFEDDIQKGKAGIVGEIRTWNGKKMRKEANGKWKEVSEDKSKKSENSMDKPEGSFGNQDRIDKYNQAQEDYGKAKAKEDNQVTFTKIDTILKKYSSSIKTETPKTGVTFEVKMKPDPSDHSGKPKELDKLTDELEKVSIKDSRGFFTSTLFGINWDSDGNVTIRTKLPGGESEKDTDSAAFDKKRAEFKPGTKVTFQAHGDTITGVVEENKSREGTRKIDVRLDGSQRLTVMDIDNLSIKKKLTRGNPTINKTKNT